MFVGLTAAGLHDVFAVPFGSQGKMPGPQIHASLTDQILGNRFVAPAGPPAGAALTAGGGALRGVAGGAGPHAGVAAAGRRGRGRTGGAGRVGLRARHVVPRRRCRWAPSASRPSVASPTSTSSKGREKRAVKRLFSRYLSRDVYEQLLANPALAELGGKRRDMSVLFSDIRGFTAMTEKGQAEELVAQLNEYFSQMVEVVFAHRGTLDKFVGDMVMALFGAPLDDEQHADHAVQAALAMVRELERLNAKWAAEGKPTFGIGVGINSGDMIAGNIGAETIRSYTVIGDNVNLGSRLESLNKDFKTSIIISSYTVERLKETYDLAPAGRGRREGQEPPGDHLRGAGPAGRRTLGSVRRG